MTAIDTYGEFDLPEETSVIEVVEDPVKTVISCYELFKKIKQHRGNLYDDVLAEKRYQQTLKIFEDKTELKANTKQVIEIIEAMKKKAKLWDGTGLFLSGLINSTKINNLIIKHFSGLDDLGYCLKKDKTIIICSKSQNDYLGMYAEGNTINLGKIKDQGTEAKGGTHINLGTTLTQGCNAIRGNFINRGIIEDDQGFCASGGIFINQEILNDQLEERITKSRIYINLKKNKAHKSSGEINLSKKQHPLKTRLEQKLAELDFLQEKQPEKLLELVSGYNWNKFDKDLTEICRKIQEAYKK